MFDIQAAGCEAQATDSGLLTTDKFLLKMVALPSRILIVEPPLALPERAVFGLLASL